MAKTNKQAHLTLAILCLAVALVFVGIVVLSVQAPHSSSSFISLSATGTASATPNTVDVYISLNGTGNTTAYATANLSVTTTLFNKTIQPFVNGNSSLIQTTYYEVYKPYSTGCYYPVAAGSSSNGTNVGAPSPAYPVPMHLLQFHRIRGP